MSGLNVSVGSRHAPVVRSEAEWNSIMADFERSGLSRRVHAKFLVDLNLLSIPGG